MTYENIINKIAELIVARRNAHGNDKEQQRINKKLEKYGKNPVRNSEKCCKMPMKT